MLGNATMSSTATPCGNAIRRQREQLALDAVRADEVALDRPRCGSLAHWRAGSSSGSTRKSSEVERHCVRFICTPISHVPSRRCLRCATRATVMPQPSSSARPGSQRSCSPRCAQGVGDRRSSRRGGHARPGPRQPGAAGRLLMERIDRGTADDRRRRGRASRGRGPRTSAARGGRAAPRRCSLQNRSHSVPDSR